MDFRAVEFRPFRAGLYFDVRTHRALPWAITLRPVGAKGKKLGDSPRAIAWRPSTNGSENSKVANVLTGSKAYKKVEDMPPKGNESSGDVSITTATDYSAKRCFITRSPCFCSMFSMSSKPNWLYNRIAPALSGNTFKVSHSTGCLSSCLRSPFIRWQLDIK